MSLFDINENEKKTFEKINFLYFEPGQHVVRILGKPKKFYTHFISTTKISVKCLDEDCPICASNKKLIAEHPKTFRDVPGYSSKSPRHYFNVLDRTEVKICQECGEEVKRDMSGKFPAVCKNSHLVVEAPIGVSGKVKVASISEANAVQINTHIQSILGEDGSELGLNAFDFMFMVTKSGGKKNITPLPLKDKNDVVEVADEFLYNLDDAPLTLDPKEILSLLSGVSLRDIFLARGSSVLEEKEESVNSDIKKEIANLFGE
jgi:hypothetical protein